MQNRKSGGKTSPFIIVDQRAIKKLNSARKDMDSLPYNQWGITCSATLRCTDKDVFVFVATVFGLLQSIQHYGMFSMTSKIWMIDFGVPCDDSLNLDLLVTIHVIFGHRI